MHSKLGDGFCQEMHCPYDVRFLKADGMWNAIVRLKKRVVEGFFGINITGSLKHK